MQIRRKIFVIFFLATAWALAGCAPSTHSATSASVAAESDICEGPKVFAGGVTLHGKAFYKKRLTEVGGLSAEESNPFPIRYAEIQVLDGQGTVVQCGATDAEGLYSVQVPASTALRVRVNSRAQNSHVVVSVLDAPNTNQFYSLEMDVVSGSGPVRGAALPAQNVPDLIAHANGDVLGGAFNIFDDIVRANEFLISNTSSCADYFGACRPFVTGFKCSVYWKKGFNPAAYVGGTSGLSFYMPGTSQLYILGGMNGDTDNSDTDHFDDSVIIHEYGHFIEDLYSQSDSPGGFHSASKVIDPRVAWGEGWANFFSSAVLNRKTYVDTCGNKSGSPCGANGFLFDVDISKPDLDFPNARPGEGNFRELAVTSTLFNFLSEGRSTKDIGAPRFNELWANYTGPFRDPRLHFRNVGLFFQLHQEALVSPHELASFAAPRYQRLDQTDYALPVVAGAQSCAFTSDYGNTDLFFDPRVDWLGNNDPYQVNITTRGNYDFRIRRLAGAADVFVNFFIFNEQHSYITEGTCGPDGVCFNFKGDVAQGWASASLGSQDLDLSVTLDPGTYLIVANLGHGGGAGPAARGSLTYTLTMNGASLCKQ